MNRTLRLQGTSDSTIIFWLLVTFFGVSAMDSYLREVESENLNLFHLMSKMGTEYKVATVVLEGSGLNSLEHKNPCAHI